MSDLSLPPLSLVPSVLTRNASPSGVPLATLTAGDLVGLRLDVLLEALRSDEPVAVDPVMAAAAQK